METRKSDALGRKWIYATNGLVCLYVRVKKSVQSEDMARSLKSTPEVLARYRAKNIKQYAIQVNRNTESDIIAILDNQDNKQGFIKQAIREKSDRDNNLSKKS